MRPLEQGLSGAKSAPLEEGLVGAKSVLPRGGTGRLLQSHFLFSCP